jgi:hypothetical protein
MSVDLGTIRWAVILKDKSMNNDKLMLNSTLDLSQHHLPQDFIYSKERYKESFIFQII